MCTKKGTCFNIPTLRHYSMLKSELCERIELCKSIDKLNRDGCLEVIRLMSNIFDNNILNRLLIGTIVNSNGMLCDNQLQAFGKEFYQLLSSNPKFIQQCSSNTHSNCNHQPKKVKKKEKTEKQLFPLLRLPIDIITNISFYFKENDIFVFEQCCRLFYTMINNTSYLKQSNNFKTFKVNNDRLEQMIQSRCSFFKYSKARQLQFRGYTDVHLDDTQSQIDEFFNNLQNQWDNIQSIDRNGDLFNSIFTSIKSLEFNQDGMPFVAKMPVRLLFDHESQLETIKFDHYWNDDKVKQCHSSIEKFEEKYVLFKNEIEQCGKKIKKLRQVLHHNRCSYHHVQIRGLKQLSTYHLRFTEICTKINPFDVINATILTCDNLVRFECNLTEKKQDNNCSCGILPKIKTLRLLEFLPSALGWDICNNTNVIQSFNLHYTCNNLLIEISRFFQRIVNGWHQVKVAVECILKKQDYYNLQNFNLLIEFEENNIEWFFDLLKQNKQILKYQFKQFNIGLKDVNHNVYKVIKWNDSIDDKYLDKLRHECKESIIPQHPNNKRKQHRALLNEWSCINN